MERRPLSLSHILFRFLFLIGFGSETEFPLRKIKTGEKNIKDIPEYFIRVIKHFSIFEAIV